MQSRSAVTLAVNALPAAGFIMTPGKFVGFRPPPINDKPPRPTHLYSGSSVSVDWPYIQHRNGRITGSLDRPTDIEVGS